MDGYHPPYLAAMMLLHYFDTRLVIVIHFLAMYIIFPTLMMCGWLDSCSFRPMVMVLVFLLLVTIVIAMRNNEERDLCSEIIEWELLSLATIVIISCGIYAWIPLTYTIMLLVVPIIFGIILPNDRSYGSICSDPESVDKCIYKSEFDHIIR